MYSDEFYTPKIKVRHTRQEHIQPTWQEKVRSFFKRQEEDKIIRTKIIERKDEEDELPKQKR